MTDTLNLGFEAKACKYISSEKHKLIGVGDHLLDNIGSNGENLTIAVLSMNRSYH